VSGRYYNHANYGNMVIIEADNGNSYVSLSAHLLGLAEGIVRGAMVTDETIIGYAGDTGNPTTIPVGPPHLNQTFYRKPKYSWVNNAPIGPPYGGAGLHVIYHRSVGDARKSGPGVYEFDWTVEGEWISNLSRTRVGAQRMGIQRKGRAGYPRPP
jgi:murein DD-endopeptidase MepM/ murein hydrolase activator NlpD